MFKNKVLRLTIITLLVVIAGYFVMENFIGSDADSSDLATTNPTAYAAKITAERTAKDEEFRSGSDSPIADKESFHGLHYFKVNPEYHIRATISPYMKDDKTMTVKYTDGSSETYEKFGYAHFELGKQPQKLLLLKHEGVVSVLFRDETSGKESYGGGRYLDYPAGDIKNNVIILDFNKAYNPYCAYQESYACPVPPAENNLKVSVFAGEQYEGGVH